MSTSEDGFNNYFHCLIISEEVGENELVNDFSKTPERSRFTTEDEINQQTDDEVLSPEECIDSLRNVHKKNKNFGDDHDDGEEELFLH